MSVNPVDFLNVSNENLLELESKPRVSNKHTNGEQTADAI